MAKGFLIVVIFVVLALAAFVNFPKDNGEAAENKIIADSMAEIDLYCQKLMFTQAKSVYSDLAKNHMDNSDITLGYIDFCIEHGYMKEAQAMCNSLLAKDAGNKAIAEKLLGVYYSTGSNDMYTFMSENKQLVEDTETYAKIKSEAFGKYRYMGSSYAKVDDWSGNDYTFIYSNEGKMGVSSSTGDVIVSPAYDNIYSYTSDKKYIAIKDHDQIVYASTNGQRALVPYNSSEKTLIYLDYAGPFENGFANINNNGVWTYVSDSMGIGPMQYEESLPFCRGISAVKENGKWSLIDKNFKPIINGAYNNLYHDQYGHFLFGEIIYLDNGNGWQPYKITREASDNNVSYKIEAIGSETFEEVKPFGEYGAVKKGGVWGFIRSDGTWLIKPRYDDAYSFSCGLAPVLEDGKWGYIGEDGSVAIEFTFDEAISFNNVGCSAVKSGEKWKFIQLEEYYYIGR